MHKNTNSKKKHLSYKPIAIIKKNVRVVIHLSPRRDSIVYPLDETGR